MKISVVLKKLVESNSLFLSSCDNNFPHTVCVAYAKIRDNTLIITDNYMEKTVENILKNPFVSISFLDNEKGFELLGQAKYFSKGKFLGFVKNIPENKGLPCKGAIVVSIKSTKGMH